MRLWMLVLLVFVGCSNGRLDAFTREGEGAGGAPSGGSASGGAARGGAPSTGGTGMARGGTSNSGGGMTGPLVLDDFEDGDNQTLPPMGWWYVETDMTPNAIMMDTKAPNAHGGARSLRVYGSGCRDWCFLGVDLPGEEPFDARAYSRISFWARAEPSSVVHTLSVDVLDSPNGVHFRNDIDLSAQWGNYTVNFAELVPTESSSTAVLDRSHLIQVEFWIFSPEAFDFYIDDVVFLP
ncbi:MAG TPA: hypothetical protein VFQ35_04810 [Polyangiaceae bacterium]|nr:hypothetical protein [Polyangiaceae bacterium]